MTPPLVRPLGDHEVGADVRALFQANTAKGYQDASFMRLLGHYRSNVRSALAKQQGLDESLVAALADALHEEFTDAQIVELAFATAMFSGAGRMVAAMGLTLAGEREHTEGAR
jgi:hypothetical protein